MHSHHPAHAAQKFGSDRAAQYDAQVAAFPGYHAMHEVSASALASVLAGQDTASLLVVGIGTGQDVVPFLQYGKPGWRFTGVDPSPDMLAVAQKRLAAQGLLERTHLHTGELHTLPPGPSFDGGEMIGVLHHVEGEEARLSLLREVTRRLAPGAPFVLGCRVGNDPQLQDIEVQQWRVHGLSPEEVERRRQGLSTLRPPESDAALFALLERAGLVAPRQLFALIQFKVFLTRVKP